MALTARPAKGPSGTRRARGSACGQGAGQAIGSTCTTAVKRHAAQLKQAGLLMQPNIYPVIGNIFGSGIAITNFDIQTYYKAVSNPPAAVSSNNPPT